MSNKKVNHALVAGTKPRYVLHLSCAAEEAGYGPLHRLEFDQYRAAQDVANAVKAAMSLREATA